MRHLQLLDLVLQLLLSGTVALAVRLLRLQRVSLLGIAQRLLPLRRLQLHNPSLLPLVRRALLRELSLDDIPNLAVF